MTEKRQTSQGCIIRILQHFATKLRNITNFVILCSPDLSRSKFHSKGERSIRKVMAGKRDKKKIARRVKAKKNKQRFCYQPIHKQRWNAKLASFLLLHTYVICFKTWAEIMDIIHPTSTVNSKLYCAML